MTEEADVGSSSSSQLFEICMERNWLEGPIPEGLETLVPGTLSKLVLEKNKLDGEIPDSIGTLDRLWKVDVRENQLSGSIPSSFGALRACYHLELQKNRLEGKLPDSLESMRYLYSFLVARNSITGSFPDALIALDRCHYLDLSQAYLQGAMPDGVSFMVDLMFLMMWGNQLRGSVPDGLGSLVACQELVLNGNLFTGSIPTCIGFMRSLQKLSLFQVKLQGALPDAMGALQGVGKLHVSEAGLQGHIPDAIGQMKQLRDFMVQHNKVAGALPDGLRSLAQCINADFFCNGLEGSMPAAVFSMRVMFTLSLWTNKLIGAIPDGCAALQSLVYLELHCNSLKGTIPDGIGSLRIIHSMLLGDNMLVGRLPGVLNLLQSMTAFMAESNAISGALPVVVCSLQTLKILHCGKLRLGGTLPPCLGNLRKLKNLALSGKRSNGGVQPALYGVLPRGLGRASKLRAILVEGHALEGPIPSFSSSLSLVVLHKNKLQLFPHVNLAASAQTLFLHYNRLSCKLPNTSIDSRVRTSLVAMGNHLTYPTGGRFPAWVSPSEQGALFWHHTEVDLWLFAQSLAGSCILVVAFWRQVGFSEYLAIATRWHAALGKHRELAQLTSFMLDSMGLHVLGSCMLLLLVLQCDFYACAGVRVLASACLLRTSSPQVLVVLLWWRFCTESMKPSLAYVCGSFFTSSSCSGGSPSPSNSRARRTRSLAARATLAWHWVLWLLFVLVMSQLTVLCVAAKCTASILSVHGLEARLLDASIGALQGITTTMVVPFVASKVGKIRKPSLVSIATMLSSCIIPGFVVFCLDEACYGGWKLWWRPCATRRVRRFDVNYVPEKDEFFHGNLPVMHQRDVCALSTTWLVATCARSMALKLQDILLGKLVAAVLLLPACRLVVGRLPAGSDDVVVRLALLLGLGMLLGHVLPLMSPFLIAGVVSERLLAAMAWNECIMQATSHRGDVRGAVIITLICSIVFLFCFVYEDTVASHLLQLLLGWSCSTRIASKVSSSLQGIYVYDVKSAFKSAFMRAGRATNQDCVIPTGPSFRAPKREAVWRP